MPAPRAADRCDYVGTGSGGSLRHVKNAARTATPLRAGAIIAGRRRGCKGSLKNANPFSGCLLCFQTASDAAAGCVAQATHAVCGGWGNARIETFAPRRHSRAGGNPAGAYAMPCFSKRCRRPDKIPACAGMTEQEVLPAQLEKRHLRFRLLSTFSDGLRCCRRVCGSATHAVFWSGACVGLGKTKGRLKTAAGRAFMPDIFPICRCLSGMNARPTASARRRRPSENRQNPMRKQPEKRRPRFQAALRLQ